MAGDEPRGPSMADVLKAAKLLRANAIPQAECFYCGGKFYVFPAEARPTAPAGMTPLIACDDCQHQIECHGETS